ncbi:MAG: hypothetical protein LN417_07030, partial [Candidatus Thermoplasmatota archaeon]|nr:hypothetical protein [Candidatus Thermoplasmatota archaeon]
SMSAVDSGFDTPLERVTSPIDLSGFAEGIHNFCVYGRDYSGNFNASGTACAQLTIGTPPEPPVMLDATLTGQGLSNVTISWQRSADDGGGFDDIVSYDVYQSDTLGSGYTLAGSVPATGSSTYSWTCVGCGEGDPGNHFFYVSAIDGLFSISAANRVAKFTGPLAPGPNLVSIPLIQSDGSIETVLQTVLYDRAWYYDSSSKEWKWCNRIKEYRRGLWDLNHTMGAWINVTLDSNLTVAGLVPAQTVIHLHEGWNLVSFPSFNSSYSVADLKLEIGPTRVEGNDPVQPYFLTVLEDADLLRAGYGYWVRVDAALDWIVHVS